MIIDRTKIKNPYLIVYVDKFNIADGEELKPYKYMFWIDKKHSDYRKLHNIPEHLELSGNEINDFIEYIKNEVNHEDNS